MQRMIYRAFSVLKEPEPMPICKTCGKQFHACSSCGLYHEWEYEYHNHDCWIKSPEYATNRVKYLTLMKTLNEAQRTLFKHFLDLSDGYALEYEKWDQELNATVSETSNTST